MRKTFIFLLLVIVSCKRQGNSNSDRIITVSIAPFKYFVEAIAGEDFKVNVMVPSGSDPHIYEPVPDQINKLSRSVGYISNGYLGFEMNWLNRFYETNRLMKRLSLSEKIVPIAPEGEHSGKNIEGADPHYWVSPKCGIEIALSVRDFLINLNEPHRQKYEANCQALISKIKDLDNKAQGLFSGFQNRVFMIYHPNLAYIARDYGLKEIAVEFEGKEPSPSRIRDLIDMAKQDDLKTIFVQKEYDTRNAKAIAKEIGANIQIIDPLNENWMESTSEIIDALYKSLEDRKSGM